VQSSAKNENSAIRIKERQKFTVDRFVSSVIPCWIWTSHSDGYIDVATCSPEQIYRRFGGTYCLHLQGPKLLLLAWLTLRPWRWGAVRSSKTLANFYRATRRQIPEDNIPHMHSGFVFGRSRTGPAARKQAILIEVLCDFSVPLGWCWSTNFIFSMLRTIYVALKSDRL
jgi:hypothetical protein